MKNRKTTWVEVRKQMEALTHALRVTFDRLASESKEIPIEGKIQPPSAIIHVHKQYYNHDYAVLVVWFPHVRGIHDDRDVEVNLPTRLACPNRKELDHVANIVAKLVGEYGNFHAERMKERDRLKLEGTGEHAMLAYNIMPKELPPPHKCRPKKKVK
jgi:hypothetical protein